MRRKVALVFVLLLLPLLVAQQLYIPPFTLPATTCTNQFIRSIAAATGVGSCASVAIGSDVSGLGSNVATALGTPSTSNLATAFNTAPTTTTPTPTSSGGAFTTVSSVVKQQLLPGTLIYVTVTVTVTTVNTASGQILVTVPTAAASTTSCSAIDTSNGAITMVGQIISTTVSIIPTAGIIGNNVYIATCLYPS